MGVYRRILGAVVVVAVIAAAATPAADAFPGRSGALAYQDDNAIPGTPARISIEVLGSGAGHRVTSPGVAFTHPRWSADGTRLLLTGSSAGEGRQLWVVDVGVDLDDPRFMSSTGLHRLTAPGDGDNTYGTWSPDGRQIAYVRTPTGGGVPQVWRMRADGTQPKQLAWSRRGSADPDWSPDGREIAFTTWPVNAADQGPRIFAMNATDGTGKRKITITPGRRPAWSPDGQRLLFEALAPVSSIDVVRRDGQQLRTVMAVHPGSSTQYHWPRWSPDATELVFISDNRSRVPHDPGAYRAPVFVSLTGVRSRWEPIYGDDADWQPLPDSPSPP